MLLLARVGFKKTFIFYIIFYEYDISNSTQAHNHKKYPSIDAKDVNAYNSTLAQ